MVVSFAGSLRRVGLGPHVNGQGQPAGARPMSPSIGVRARRGPILRVKVRLIVPLLSFNRAYILYKLRGDVDCSIVCRLQKRLGSDRVVCSAQKEGGFRIRERTD